ncbi:hypothetical protein NG796_24150 [Laspinema sp. A4]|nr:hypothetical protein [Laspinema sp. D2d]
MANYSKNLSIAVVVGIVIVAACAWQAPQELHQVIPDAVIAVCTVFQTLPKK